MNESNVGSTARRDVKNTLQQSLSNPEMTCPDMPKDMSQEAFIYLLGVIGGSRVLWLIYTGAACLILSLKIYNSLPTSINFSLSSARSAIALADGKQAKTDDVAHVVVRLGTKEFQMRVVVAEIEDEGNLGMDLLSQCDSHIDIVKNQVSISGEVFDYSDFKN